MKYAEWKNSAWHIQTVDKVAPNNGGFFSSSLAINKLGNPCIGYYDYSDDDLKYATWTGSAWNIQVVDGPRLRAGTRRLLWTVRAIHT